MTQCDMLLKVLEDGRCHRNFDILREIRNRFYETEADLSMFPIAARIKDLDIRGYKIESGIPEKFGKERKSKGDWYYQLESVTKCNGLEQFSPEPEPAYSCAENGQMEMFA